MELRSKKQKLSVPNGQPEPRLPPEIWEAIFDNLLVYQLLRVRLTCRQWKQIVDGSPALKGKIAVRLEQIGRDFKPTCLYNAPTAYFYRVTIVDPPEHWWPSFGAGLTSLTLERIDIPHGTLLWMLRRTPNLKRLVLGRVDDLAWYDEAAIDATDLRLDKLEYLTVRCLETVMMYNTLAIFGAVCPRLKHVGLGHDYYDTEQEIPSVADFFRTVQHLLSEIVLGSSIHKDMGSISQLDQLRLKRLTIRGAPRGVIDVLRKQTALEDVTVTCHALSIENLCEIGRNLPHLRHLEVDVAAEHPLDQPVVPSFLTQMTGLEEFNYRGSTRYHESYTLDFRKIGSPSLKSLGLSSFHINLNNFCQYLRKSPNIQTITLSGCHCSNWAKLFTFIAKLKHLKHLHLEHISDMYEADNYFSENFHSLQTLSIVNCEISKFCLLGLFRHCPHLLELQVISVYDFDDDVLLRMCQQLEQLKELTLWPIDDVLFPAKHIIDNCKSLELLVVKEYTNFSKHSIRQIHQKLGIGVIVQRDGSTVARYR